MKIFLMRDVRMYVLHRIISSINIILSKMKRRIINGFLMATLLVGAVGTTVSCKDTDEDAIADLRGQLQRENASLKEVLEAQIKGLQSQVSVLESAKAACESELADVKTRLAAVEKAIKESNYLTKEEADKYYVKIEAYLEKITELETAIRKLDAFSAIFVICRRRISTSNVRSTTLTSLPLRLPLTLKRLSALPEPVS